MACHLKQAPNIFVNLCSIDRSDLLFSTVHFAVRNIVAFFFSRRRSTALRTLSFQDRQNLLAVWDANLAGRLQARAFGKDAL